MVICIVFTPDSIGESTLTLVTILLPQFPSRLIPPCRGITLRNVDDEFHGLLRDPHQTYKIYIISKAPWRVGGSVTLHRHLVLIRSGAIGLRAIGGCRQYGCFGGRGIVVLSLECVEQPRIRLLAVEYNIFGWW